jgi:polyisoprenyl-teichoic acid--peptidoglycan teichoic acid transferase
MIAWPRAIKKHSWRKGLNDEKDGGQGGAEQPREKRRRRHSRWFYVILILVLAIVAGVGALAVTFIHLTYGNSVERIPIVEKTAPNATQPPDLAPGDGTEDQTEGEEELNLDVGTTPIYAHEPISSDVVNILVLGLDSRKPGGPGRSDLNMIVSIDKRQGTIKLVSLLRDTLVPIEGHDWNRLNSAYLFGGPGMSINTVNDAYDMDIQRYVKLDFFAIQDIIDAVGGVEVQLTDAEVTYLRSYGHDISKGAGVKHLNGEQALAYSRIRKIDSDFRRAQRQRNLLTAMLGKARGMGTVKAINLMTSLLPKIKTNIGTAEVISLATEVLGVNGELRQMTLPIKDAYSDKKYKGMSILSVDFDKNTAALKEFLYGTK